MSLVLREKDARYLDRKERIVITAVQVFVDRGYGGFSLRRVAKEAGISLGHLQHFFKTKADLLTAIFDHVNARYDEVHAALMDALPDEPEGRLSQYIDYLLRDIRDTTTNHFFFDFWALASRDKDAARVMDRMYTAHQQRIEKLIADIRPDLSERHCKLLSAQIVAQIEGLMVLLHHEMPYHRELEDLGRNVASNLMQLVCNSKPDGTPITGCSFSRESG